MAVSCKFDVLTTVFVATRLWKTKYTRKRFQNFRQSCLLLTDRIEIHQSDSMTQRRLEGHTVIGGIRSDLPITRKTDGNFENASA